MSKKYELNIGKYFINKVEKPIREKDDVIVLLLETIKMFLIGNIINEQEKQGIVILNIDKMSRLVFEINDKCFSINFPFNVKDENEKLVFYDSKLDLILHDRIIADLMGIFSNNKLTKSTMEDLFEGVMDIEDNIMEGYDIYTIWELVKKLLLFESGYLRYEYDKENEKGLLHPLNHFDIYFSSGNTFKIGLDDKLNSTDFIDILNIRTECHFLKNFK